MTNVPDAAINLIKRYEGCRLSPYICPAGFPTIGWGSIFGEDGKAVTMAHPPITQETADRLLLREVDAAERQVMSVVKTPINPNQLGALVSFVYNLGIGRLKASTLLRRLNAGDYDGAAEEFSKWVFAGKRKLDGLVKRREAEKRLWQEANI